MKDIETMLRELGRMMDVQKDSVDEWDTNSYHQGMYNGMEFARAILTDTEPIYIDTKGTLDMEAMERNPERYV